MQNINLHNGLKSFASVFCNPAISVNHITHILLKHGMSICYCYIDIILRIHYAAASYQIISSIILP